VTQINGWLLILCHKRHVFQLKMHYKAFGGRAAPGPTWEVGVGLGGRKEEEGMDTQLLQTDRSPIAASETV